MSKCHLAIAFAGICWQLPLSYAAEVEDVPATQILLTVEDMMEGGVLDFQQAEEPVLINPDATAYQFYITDLESRQGAYAPGLAEQLVGLGRSYQDQGLYPEAIKVLKRAVHVTRINNGLNGSLQIPLLEQLIQALIANGDYVAADERQYYLYRLQQRLYRSTDPQMSAAMMRRANWERQAYVLSVGEESFARLINMRELYGAVVNNIAITEGKTSTLLLAPLNDLAQTLYLIAAHLDAKAVKEKTTVFQFGTALASNPPTTALDLAEIKNNRQGKSVFNAIRVVLQTNEVPGSSIPTVALLDLGDWTLRVGEKKNAWGVYREAWAEFSQMEDAERLLEDHFGRPVMIPAWKGAHADLGPIGTISGYAEITYAVNTRGRVYDLRLVSNQPGQATPDAEPRRLMRSLKRKLFRPRYDNGEPVETVNIVKRYAY